MSSKHQLYWSIIQEKKTLREEFRTKFRNISRIMDCVTCERCRTWGKLQILGLGTAVKILLSSSNSNYDNKDENEQQNCQFSRKDFDRVDLNRQEIIALINTLNQLSKV